VALSTFQTSDKLFEQDWKYLFLESNEFLDRNSLFKSESYKKVFVDSSETFYYIKENESSGYIPPEKEESIHPIFNTFYKTPANFFEVNKPNFHLSINPILYLTAGKEKNVDETIFFNRRGVEMRGMIEDKVYFYTNILETQAKFPDFIEKYIDETRAVPGEGFYKRFEGGLFGTNNGRDFLNSQGYVGANLSRYFQIEMGHGKHFIGNGYRSLFLSDFGNNTFYLKFNTKIWKFQYQNLFAELNLGTQFDSSGDGLIPKKYIASHYLDLALTKNFNIGLFETVIFSRNNQFELQYLNPIILYRTVEQSIGSPDNVLIGLNGEWRFLQKYSLYGQLLLDEFKVKELTSSDGWWANKYGIQAGMKAINLFDIKNFDAQIEFNTIRPYTYSHRDSSSNYSHYSQPLAHPLGANFKELMLAITYRPVSNFWIQSRFFSIRQGKDEIGLNYGSNIILPNSTREMEYGNKTGQGINSKTSLFQLLLSYEFKHNYFWDFDFGFRSQNENNLKNNSSYFQTGIRVNIARNQLEF
jgi:hypothetical protein